MTDNERAGNKGFYEVTKTNPPSKALVEVVEILGHTGQALDLGCGAGKDTRYLLEQGFTVTAVDKDSQTQGYLKSLTQDHLNPVISSFENFQFGHYDLINAQNTLSFIDKDKFLVVIERLKASLNNGGVFVGTLFGDHDEWNISDSKMSFVTKEQSEELFKDMHVIKFEERDFDGNLANGTPKHWHIFYIIAQK